MTRTILGILGLSAIVSAYALDLTDEQRAAIEDRISPIGSVCLAGDSSCGGPVLATSGVPRTGEEVYNAACMACHTTGAGGAPMLGDAAAWTDRLAQGNDVLYDHGINGIPGTAMIAKGGCADCSDDDIVAAVDYMIDNSK